MSVLGHMIYLFNPWIEFYFISRKFSLITTMNICSVIILLYIFNYFAFSFPMLVADTSYCLALFYQTSCIFYLISSFIAVVMLLSDCQTKIASLYFNLELLSKYPLKMYLIESFTVLSIALFWRILLQDLFG